MFGMRGGGRGLGDLVKGTSPCLYLLIDVTLLPSDSCLLYVIHPVFFDSPTYSAMNCREFSTFTSLIHMVNIQIIIKFFWKTLEVLRNHIFRLKSSIYIQIAAD